MKLILFQLLVLCILHPLKAIDYFVNDASTAGDLGAPFATAVGNAGNNGLTQATPKLSIQAIISSYTLGAGDRVYIQSGTYTEDILLSGVNGSSGSNIQFIGAGTTLTNILGVAGGSAFTVHLLNSSYISWDNVKVTTVVGEWAFAIYMNSHYNRISNCETDADQYGVDIERNTTGVAPTNNIIERCVINSKWVGIRIKSENTEAGGWAGSATTGPMNNIVRDNVVKVTNTNVFAALELQTTRANEIYRNVFVTNGNNGTSGTVFFGHSCTGVQLYNNYIVNHKTFTNASNFNAAITFDDNSGVSITHNSFYSESHTFYFVDGGASNTLTNVSLTNNIFYSNLLNAIHFPSDNAKFGFCNGNMYYAPAGSVAHTNGTNRTLASWQTYDPDAGAAGSETNGLNANPLYVAPATDLLNLNTGSPAIDAAVVVTAVADDIYLTSRPQGAAKEIGAYEMLPLPINMLYFEKACLTEGVLFEWATASETDNREFTIEKSLTGYEYESLETISGAGNSNSVKTYSLTLANPGDGYYRIKQTDNDGTTNYFNPVYVDCNNSEVLDVWTVDKSILIQYNSISGPETGVLNLYSVSGQLLKVHEFEIQRQRPYQFDVQDLTTGVYIVHVYVKGSPAISKKIHIR